MVAILVTATIYRIKRILPRQVVLISILFLMFCNYLSLSFWHIRPLKWLNEMGNMETNEGNYAHISYESNYIEILSDIANRIRTDFKGNEIPKIGIVESPLFWNCDGFPLLEYLLRLYIPEMTVLGDKRSPREFYSNYQNFDYFIIIEQYPGCGRDSLAIFDEQAWESLGDPTFNKIAPKRQVIKYINESKILGAFNLLPESLMIYLTKVEKHSIFRLINKPAT